MIEMTLSFRHIRKGRARYLSVTEAFHNTKFYTWMGEKLFCFFQTAETGNRTPNSSVKGSGANHHPRAPARRLSRLTCRAGRRVGVWTHTSVVASLVRNVSNPI